MSGHLASILSHPGARNVTPLTPGRPNFAHAVAKVGQAFTVPPMPWQYHAAALATETLPDGRWAYDELVFTTQRRAGKTTLRVPLTWHRALIRPGCSLWLTAQTRQDARDIMVDDVGKLHKKAPRFLAARAKPRKSQGSEGWHFTNTSIWRVFAPGEDAMHGKASEMVDVDEGWAFEPLQGAAVEQAVAPTKLTTDGQFSVFSTMGTAKSTWFHGKVKVARDALAAGARERIAIVDFGVPDELVDVLRAQLEEGPDTPEWAAAIETLAHHHPAYGHTIQRVGAFDSVAQQLFKDPKLGGPDPVLRALGNVPTDTLVSIIPLAAWNARKATNWPAPQGVPMWSVTVGLDDVDAAVMAAWRIGSTVYVDVVKHAPGASWVPDFVDDKAPEWGRPVIIGDRVGPNVETLDELQRRGHYVHIVTATEYTGACSGFLRAVKDPGSKDENGEDVGAIAHPGNSDLTDAVRAAGKRTIGDGGWAWSRTKSAASIAALEGATLARWGVLSVPVMAAPGFTSG